MAFSLPTDLATNWVDNIGMFVNAAYLNSNGALGNANKAAVLALVNGTAQAVVAASESTASTSYADLTTTTDSVTVTVGSSGKALVLISANIVSNTSGGANFMGYALSGANTVSATDGKSIMYYAAVTGITKANLSGIFLETGLAAGSTVFKAKYRFESFAGSFANRRIAVIPFP